MICLVTLVLYGGFWLVMHHGFKDWSARRGLPVRGLSARLVTSAVVMVAWVPIAFAVAWVCPLLSRWAMTAGVAP